jgi:hypothetical protein
MSGEDLLAAIRGVEDRLGAELFPRVIPRLRNTPGEFIEFIDMRGGRAPEDLLPPPGRLANSLTILVDAVQLQEAGFLEGIGACLLRWTPHTLFHLVVASDAPLPAAALEWAAEAGEACETILRFHPDLLSDGGRLPEDRPLPLLESPLAPAVEREPAEMYRGLERMLITSDRPL